MQHVARYIFSTSCYYSACHIRACNKADSNEYEFLSTHVLSRVSNYLRYPGPFVSISTELRRAGNGGIIAKARREKNTRGGKKKETLCIGKRGRFSRTSYFVSTKTSDRESIVETRLLVVCAYSRAVCRVNNSSREYSE